MHLLHPPQPLLLAFAQRNQHAIDVAAPDGHVQGHLGPFGVVGGFGFGLVLAVVAEHALFAALVEEGESGAFLCEVVLEIFETGEGDVGCVEDPLDDDLLDGEVEFVELLFGRVPLHEQLDRLLGLLQLCALH